MSAAQGLDRVRKACQVREPARAVLSSARFFKSPGDKLLSSRVQAQKTKLLVVGAQLMIIALATQLGRCVQHLQLSAAGRVVLVLARARMR